MKKTHILGFVTLVLIASFGACKKDIVAEEPEQPAAPTFVAAGGVPTLVFTPAVTTLFTGDFYSVSGGDKILFTDLSITSENGSKVSDMTNLAISFRKDNGLDSVIIRFPQILSNTLSLDLAQYGMILATKQNVQVRVQAHLNPVHKGTFRIAVRLRYSGPSGSGTLSQSGPIISCQAGGISVEIPAGKSVRSTMIGNRDTLLAINTETYGTRQSLDFHCAADGSHKNETIRMLSLIDEKGVQVGSTVPNILGTFRFSEIQQDTMQKKTYYVVSDLQNDAPTGHEFGIRLTSIKSRDVVTNILTETTYNTVGNKFVVFGTKLSIVSMSTPTRIANGELPISITAYTAKGGSAWLGQFKQKIVIADNGADSIIDIRNFKLRINGVVIAKEFVFFSKANGDTAKVHDEQDDVVYATILGGYFLPKDVTVTVELLGTIKGVAGVGDAIAATLVISDPVDFTNRYFTRALNQGLGRLGPSPAISGSGVVYDFIWSDNRAVNHSGLFGISSNDWFNGAFIDTTRVHTTVLQ